MYGLPLLFGLFTVDLRLKLRRTRLDVLVGGLYLCCLIFEDDLIVISRTAKRGMDKLLAVAEGFCKKLGLSLAPAKCSDLNKGQSRYFIETRVLYHKGESAGKYLWVNLYRNPLNTREEDFNCIARIYVLQTDISC